jgi:hypothetical protein
MSNSVRTRFWNNLHQGQKIGNHNNLNVVYSKNTKGLTQDSQTRLKKSLKIPKGQSESVYQRRADKRTNNDLQNIYIKLKIE